MASSLPESMSESESEENPTVSHTDQPSTFNPQFLGQTPTPWVDYAIQQARLYQKTLEETFDSAIEASKSRLSQILSTSSAHFHQTLDSLEDIKSEYGAYEDIIFGKIKEGIFVAASHPVLAGGFATGLGFLVLKKPRQLLYHKTLRLFLSEETLLSRADAKVKALQQSLDVIKTESEKLEVLNYFLDKHLGDSTLFELSVQAYVLKDYEDLQSKKGVKQAEEELIRGRTKLRQAGKQIQGLIRSAYKIERQARGLRDILGELPRREASRFRSQVSGLTLEAKRERNALTKEVTKISNYGISV